MHLSKDLRVLIRIQLFVTVLFICFKLIRRYFLDETTPIVLKVFLQSFPNFAEAIIGTLSLTMIGLVIRLRYKNLHRFKETSIYNIAIVFATIYVLLQEFKIHNLGGPNIFDWYDVLFSILGLITITILLYYLKPTHH